MRSCWEGANDFVLWQKQTCNWKVLSCRFSYFSLSLKLTSSSFLPTQSFVATILETCCDQWDLCSVSHLELMYSSLILVCTTWTLHNMYSRRWAECHMLAPARCCHAKPIHGACKRHTVSLPIFFSWLKVPPQSYITVISHGETFHTQEVFWQWKVCGRVTCLTTLVMLTHVQLKSFCYLLPVTSLTWEKIPGSLPLNCTASDGKLGERLGMYNT